MRYFIKTYGCAMNVSDSEMIAGWFKQKGWKQAKRIDDADEIVIVTCSVRQTAEDRVYGFINNLKARKSIVIPASPERSRRTKAGIYKNKFQIVVTGCMLRYPIRWLREKMPEVDEFKKVSDYILNTKYLALNTEKPTLVPIMGGCNNFCSYCVVPYARGKEVSRPFEEIVCEVEELAKRGCKEITLLGQNVNSYGKDFNNLKFEIFNLKSIFNDKIFKTRFKTPFAILLEVLDEIPDIEKISFLTSNPWDLDDEIIEAMSLPKIDRYLHLPVQSGDDGILKKMNRKYTVADYIKLVEKIRKRIPDIKVGTDIIVGFPGETEKQFQNTVDLCKKVSFVKAYVSMYSPRLQTAAYKLTDDIPHKEKRRRWKILDDLINKK